MMFFEKQKVAANVSIRALLLSGFLLVTIGGVIGYVGRGLISPGQYASVSKLSKDSMNTAAGSGALNHQSLLTPLVVTTQKKTRKKYATTSDSERLIELTQDRDAMVSESFMEGRTASIDLETGNIENDPDLESSDPELLAEIIEEYEAEYHQELQEFAETEAQLSPSEMEMDDDDLENEYLYDNLEEVGDEELSETLKSAELQLDIRQQELVDTPLPGEELSVLE